MPPEPLELHLSKISASLERLCPLPPGPTQWGAAKAFVWQAQQGALKPVMAANALNLDALRAIEPQKVALLANTRQFAAGHGANNALLWGARGMGKSALVKAVHAALSQGEFPDLRLVEMRAEDLHTLDRVLEILRRAPYRVILFIDDLAFTGDDAAYRALKTILDGSIEGRPAHVIVYATSNRRHLMPRDASENEHGSSLLPHESVDEKISLSDRFGLWLGVHACTQEEYLDIVGTYAAAAGLTLPKDALHRQALAWAAQRGSRSGRVAWQFMQDLCGQMGRTL